MKKEDTLIKALVFDNDGVIIGGEKFSKRLEREHGISIEQTAGFFTGQFQECLVGNLDLKEAIKPYIEEWGWPGKPSSFLEYWFSSDNFSVSIELSEYIQVTRESGIKCYLATNQEKYRTKYLWNEVYFSNLFDGVYASFGVGAKKPSFVFYDRMVSRLRSEHGIQKHEILFWDDSPENITSARECGIHAEMYSSFTDFKRRIKVYPQFLK